jgi:hypothetical protein
MAEIKDGVVVAVFDWGLSVLPQYADRIAVDVSTVIPEPGSGWVYDADNGTFSEPGPPSTPRKISKWDFVMRFTPEERAAVLAASKTDSDVEQVLQVLSFADPMVDLDLPIMVGSVAMLEAKSLLADGRGAEILG